jgi:VWFA-related protein
VRRPPFILLCLIPLCGAQQSADTPAQGDTFKFESKVNVVLVPVLVRDAHGNAVGTLKKDDFHVFDKDKLQTLTGFTIQKRATSVASAEEALKSAAPIPSNMPTSLAVVPERSIVFLFDDLNLGTADLVQAKKASTRMLSDSLAPADMVAVLSTSGRTNSGMTRDRGKLADAIASLREQRIYRPLTKGCPDVSYFQADLILNKNDGAALGAATQEAMDCAHLDPHMRDTAERMAHSSAQEAMSLGEQGTRVDLQVIKLIVKKMAALPGQHTLILISPGFLSVTAEALTAKSEIMDMAAQANVTISALDARGLYVTILDASESSNGNPQTMRAKSQYHVDAMSTNEDVMAELADGTGGTYFHNSNDLAEGFRKLTLAPEYLYLLEFTPQDTKQDGSYHRLKVKIDQDGLKLQARRGYFALKASKKKS